MPRSRFIYTNFTAGELSPRLRGRVDIDRYYNGMELGENVIIHPHGGSSRRCGTIYVDDAKHHDKAARLVKFIFSETQAYVIEMGDQILRLFNDRAGVYGGTGSEMVTNPGFDADTDWTKGTGWTIGSEVATHASGTASSLEQTLAGLTAGVTYWVEFQMTAYTTGTLTPALGGTSGTGRTSTGWHAEAIVAGAGGKIEFACSADFVGSLDNVTVRPAGVLEIAAPWTEDQISKVRMVQYADVVYMVHPDVAPQKLSRYSHTYWTLAPVSFTATPAEWAAGNYPGAVTLFENRLWLMGTAQEPQTLLGSVVNDYEDLTTGTDDDDAVKYTLSGADGQVNKILWAVAHKVLLMGTLGALFSAGTRDGLDPITPSNVRAAPESGLSVSDIQALLVEDAVIFVGRHGKKVREASYNYTKEGYITRDLTLLAEHITGSGLVDMAWTEEPDPLLWCVRDDGVMCVGTYYPSEELIGWTRVLTDGYFESVTTIPGNDGYDEVWALVRREVDGNTVRYIEVFGGDFGEEIRDCFFVDAGLTYHEPADIEGATQANPVVIAATDHGFSDGNYVYISEVEGMTELNGHTYKVASAAANSFALQDEDGNDIDGTAFTAYTSGGLAEKSVLTLSGLDHLEGEEVDVLSDGSVHPACTVNSGSITLSRRGRKIHVGLAFSSRIKPVRPEGGWPLGTSQGSQKRPIKTMILFHQTVGGKVVLDNGDELTIHTRTTSDLMDQPVPLFSGAKVITTDGTWNRDGNFEIVQDQPLPMTVLAIAVDQDVKGMVS